MDKLSREMMLFDWIYTIKEGDAVVQVWGEGQLFMNDIPEYAVARFKPFLYPQGDEPGRVPEPFYTADYLADAGFKIVGCSASSCYEDNVFSPRHWMHFINSFDWFRKVKKTDLAGFLQTSWSVHLFPWELQLSAIAVPAFFQAQAKGKVRDYSGWFTRKYLGIDGPDFWQAAGLLSKSCLFSYTASLGFSKSCLPTPAGYFLHRIGEIFRNREGEKELANCRARLAEYQQALEIFTGLQEQVSRNRELIDLWVLAAKNLINRAEVSCLLLENPVADGLDEKGGEKLQGLLREMDGLRHATDTFYASVVKPCRRAEMMAWMFDALAGELQGLIK